MQPPAAGGSLPRSEPPTPTGPASLIEKLQRAPEPGVPENLPAAHMPPPPPRKPGPKGVKAPPPAKRPFGFLRDPLSIVLICVIVFAVTVAGLVAAELYARHTAEEKVARVVSCQVKDQATAKFGVAPLLLWQLITKHFTNITVETAGNQLREARGMKLRFTLQDVEMRDTATSQGTIGALDATVTWSSEGIRQSIQNAIPVLGAFVSSTVISHPADGTIEMRGMLNDIVAKPVLSKGGLGLQLVSFNTLGFSLPKESVQSMLNGFMAAQTSNFPLGITADDVEVTTSGVLLHLSTRNASIPGGGGGGGQSDDSGQDSHGASSTPNVDPCFAGL